MRNNLYMRVKKNSKRRTTHPNRRTKTPRMLRWHERNESPFFNRVHFLTDQFHLAKKERKSERKRENERVENEYATYYPCIKFLFLFRPSRVKERGYATSR